MRLNQDWYEGTLKFEGKEYPVAVIRNVRYIDGKTVDEFLKTLPPKKMLKFAQIGKMLLKKLLQKNKNDSNKRN